MENSTTKPKTQLQEVTSLSAEQSCSGSTEQGVTEASSGLVPADRALEEIKAIILKHDLCGSFNFCDADGNVRGYSHIESTWSPFMLKTINDKVAFAFNVKKYPSQEIMQNLTLQSIQFLRAMMDNHMSGYEMYKLMYDGVVGLIKRNSKTPDETKNPSH